jgi:flavin reductase (DIM6/NTAB) family NADH-FMN oxidoreductase RutF
MKIDPPNLDRRETHRLILDVVQPRPIAFVSTIGENGVFNLAPFSCFAPISMKPALVCIEVTRRRGGQKKDTLANIEYSKDFVVNVVTEVLAEPMNRSAAEYPSDVDEFKEVGLTPVQSDLVKSPRVDESPVNMECKLLQILEFGEFPVISSLIIAEVIRVHIKDEVLVDGRVRTAILKTIGKLGEELYCRTTDTFEMKGEFPILQS